MPTILLLLMLVLEPLTIRGAVFNVPGDHTTIQAALDATASGDTVLVERGTYAEHLIGPPHGFTLMSRFPMTRDSADWLDTILDGTDNGTCLRIPGTGFEWVSLQGLVVANGHGTNLTGGIHCKDSVDVDIQNLVIRDHRVTGQYFNEGEVTCLRLRVPVRDVRIKNLKVSNTVGDIRGNVSIDADRMVRLDSLDFDGTGNAGFAGRLWARDSTWASSIKYHDFGPPYLYSKISSSTFTSIRDLEIVNCNGDDGAIFTFGGGYSILRNVHIHDCVHTGTGEEDNEAIAIINADYVDVDSILVENITMKESDAVEIERYPNGDPNQPLGEVNHMIVRNVYAGLDAVPDEYSGRIVSIIHCSLRNSIITGNTTDLPYAPDEFTDVAAREGSALHIYHTSLDTLFIENVEVSHNTVIDHDDHWALLGRINPEFLAGNLGRAMYLSFNHIGVAIIRDCVIHDNRIDNVVPETDYYWSLGSTVHIWEAWPGANDMIIFERNSITDNDDGGIMAEWAANAIIRDCVLRNNGRYGLYLSGYRFEVQNVLIDSCIAAEFALQTLPSRQCAIKLNQDSMDPAMFRNMTIRNCEMPYLFSGSYPGDAETVFENLLLVNNTYSELQTVWNNPELDRPIRFVDCFMPELAPVQEGTLLGSDPFFDDELGFPWLSTVSPCIDAGVDDAPYDDMEDPANPGFALWPSQGTLRNDIGYTGGPYAGTLDHLVAVRKSITDPPAQPAAFMLHPAFPNPFNPSTTLSYTLDSPMQIELSVYNLLGQQVRTLASGLQDAGEHSVPFTAGELASGVYFVRLEAGGRAETQKVVLIR